MTTKAKKTNRIIWLVIAILIVVFLFRLDNPFLQAQVAVQEPDQYKIVVKNLTLDQIKQLIKEKTTSIPTTDPEDEYSEIYFPLIEKNRPPTGEDVSVDKQLRISPKELEILKNEDTTLKDVKEILADAIKVYYGPEDTKVTFQDDKTAGELVEDLLGIIKKPKKPGVLLPPIIDKRGTGPLGPPKKPGVLLPPKKDQPATGPLGDPTPKRPILPIKPKIGYAQKAVLYIDDASIDFIRKDFLKIEMPWGNYMDLYRDNTAKTAETIEKLRAIYAVVKAKSISDKQKMELYEAAMKKYREELKKYEGTIEGIVDPLGSGQSIIDSMNPLQKNKK